jgi:hypothetical protein
MMQFVPGMPITPEQRIELYDIINARMKLVSSQFEFKYELITNEQMKELLGLPPTVPDWQLTSRHMEPLYFIKLVLDEEGRALLAREQDQNKL